MKRFILPFIVIILFGVGACFFGEDILSQVSHPRRYEDTVTKYSNEYNVDTNLVYAIMKTESKFYPFAKSKMDSKGLMQISDETFDYAKTTIAVINNGIYNKNSNIQVGTWYLSTLINRFEDYRYAILAYNAGPENVSDWIKRGFLDKNTDYKSWNIPFAETRVYIDKVEKSKKYYETMKK